MLYASLIGLESEMRQPPFLNLVSNYPQCYAGTDTQVGRIFKPPALFLPSSFLTRPHCRRFDFFHISNLTMMNVYKFGRNPPHSVHLLSNIKSVQFPMSSPTLQMSHFAQQTFLVFISSLYRYRPSTLAVKMPHRHNDCTAISASCPVDQTIYGYSPLPPR